MTRGAVAGGAGGKIVLLMNGSRVLATAAERMLADIPAGKTDAFSINNSTWIAASNDRLT